MGRIDIKSDRISKMWHVAPESMINGRAEGEVEVGEEEMEKAEEGREETRDEDEGMGE